MAQNELSQGSAETTRPVRPGWSLSGKLAAITAFFFAPSSYIAVTTTQNRLDVSALGHGLELGQNPSAIDVQQAIVEKFTPYWDGMMVSSGVLACAGIAAAAWSVKRYGDDRVARALADQATKEPPIDPQALPAAE